VSNFISAHEYHSTKDMNMEITVAGERANVGNTLYDETGIPIPITADYPQKYIKQNSGSTMASRQKETLLSYSFNRVTTVFVCMMLI